MTLPRLIGLAGPAGSGKDTAADHLVAKYYYVRLSFAYAMRAMLHTLLAHCGCERPSHWMSDRQRKEQPIPLLGHSYRALAQTLGTEWGRALDPDLWVRVVDARFVSLPLHRRAVVTDVRFPNEAAWLSRAGGQLWRLERPGAEPVRQHESEQHVAQLRADAVLRNHYGIAELHAGIEQLLAPGANRSPATFQVTAP
jgi:hypothetical protein